MYDSTNKKILIVHDYLTVFGGAEKVLEGLIASFPTANIFTSKYIPKNFENSKISEAYFERKIIESRIYKYLPIPKILISFHRKISFTAFLFLNISKFDIVIFNTSAPATWIISNKKENQKFIAYYHKIPSVDFFSKKSWYLQIFRKLNNYFIQKLDLIVTNSTFNKNKFSEIYKIPENKIKVIYPFISDNDIKFIENYSQIKKENFYIYIGRLEEYKGIIQIIDTCIELGVSLKVIGDGPLKHQLKQNKNIEYLGYVDQDHKFELLSKSKCLISLGGNREEFGITYLESIICKTPFIALNIGGAVEIGDKESARFIGNIEDLKITIQEYELNPLKISDEYKSQQILKFNEDRFINEIQSTCLV